MPTSHSQAEGRGFEPLHPRLVSGITLAAIVAFLAAFAAAPRADAQPFSYGVASSYGPGLYGNRTACGQTLTPRLRGVAHLTLRCGTRLQICANNRCTHARVVDRGPYAHGRVLDLTAATTRELCSCSSYRWGVRTVAYRRGPLP
jgi:rare lipoprotein A